MTTIQLAEAIARRAHKDHTRFDGQPYITHPLRVSKSLTSDEEKAVGLLHDVIEDSPLSASNLLAEGVPTRIVEAVEVLTKRPGEAYTAFIERIATAPALERRVKLADILDNLGDQPTRNQVHKYSAALKRLLLPAK